MMKLEYLLSEIEQLKQQLARKDEEIEQAGKFADWLVGQDDYMQEEYKQRCYELETKLDKIREIID